MTRPQPSSYVHDALFYASDDELLTAAVPFLSEGLAKNETVLLECRGHVNELLTTALDDDPRVVCLPRPGSSGRPAGTIAWYQETLQAEVDGGVSRVRGVGEVDFGTTPAQWAEWARFESVINAALARFPLWGVCMYDTRVLPDEVLHAGERTHPHLLTPRERIANPQYVDPTDFLRSIPPQGPDPLESAPPDVDIPELANLADARRKVHRACLAGSAVPKRAVTEFVYAFNEVATNALLHGRRPVSVQLWVSPERLLCTVTDHGTGFDDPLAGYVPASSEPPDQVAAGQGLWLARRLSDHVDVARNSEGFCVRLCTER
jgi:anti-sigma regulatory factor (Ser/Thr protein kinase)